MLLFKKIQNFLLLFTIAAPLLLGTFFGLKQKVVQWQMQSAEENAAVETITISLSDFKWISLNKEAVIKGRLFDVKHFEINSNSITLSGFYDEKEEDLASQAAKIITEGKKQNIPGSPALLKLLFQQLYYCNTTFECKTGSIAICKQFIPLSESITSAYINNIIQPPRPFPC